MACTWDLNSQNPALIIQESHPSEGGQTDLR
ncbi:hypothetical protein CYB_0255 [Synechococcus sp. JA-2-3B'a(2-13)]|nr:hypothetical protein CYB_0255 [Synechococcus sp. JA-2-3B'a(2-13)]